MEPRPSQAPPGNRATMGLTELLRLQEDISREIHARFEKRCALLFSDVVGSTAYFERHGDVAGRRLLERHIELLTRAIEGVGRIVDTAGDGVFCVFDEPVVAMRAVRTLKQDIAEDNTRVAEEHRLSVRIGLHYAPVLTDGQIVTGDAVNVAARISASSAVDDVRISAEAQKFLPPFLRLQFQTLPPERLKGIPEPIEMAVWRDTSSRIATVRIEETGEVICLPELDLIRFGRLAEHEGRPANEIILAHTDPEITQRISRWQFELRRKPDGIDLQPVSQSPTEVDGAIVPMGQVAIVRRAVERLPGAFRVADLLGACPGVSSETVRRVLKEMKAEGQIACLGRGVKAQWRRIGS